MFLLFYVGKESKESHLTNQGWYQDTRGKFNTVDDTNLGFKARKALIATSRTVCMMGYLHCPLFNIDKLMINGVDMMVKLLPSKNSFQFIGAAAADVKLQILDIYLKVRKVKLAAFVLVAHQKALALSTAKYPITRTEVKSFVIPTGTAAQSLDNIFLSQLPKRVRLLFFK